MTPEQEARAHELYIEFDGSEFYMSRDGVDVEFETLRVPRAKRREWMKELTAAYLQRLSEPGNWKSLSFFSHHWDYSHVRAALDAEPRGVWWEKVAYLEQLLDYVGKARFRFRALNGHYAEAAAVALRYGELLQKSKNVDNARRIDALLAEARSVLVGRQDQVTLPVAD